MSLKSAIVLLSTYNGEKYLEALMESVMNQTYGNINFCIRDDGSKDNSVEIIRKFQAREYPGKKITLINDATGDWNNLGAHPSYRELFHNLPKGDFYIFCDQDDVWEPDKVERAVAAMEKFPEDKPAMYVHAYHLCDGELNVQGKSMPLKSYSSKDFENIRLEKVIMTGTWADVGMCQSCNHLAKTLCYDTPMESIVATDCIIAWVVAGMNGNMAYDEKPLAYYRRHEGTFSSGNQNGLIRYRDWLKHMDRHCNNIVNGIHEYRRFFYDMVNPERQKFLRIFDIIDDNGKRHFSLWKAIRKSCWPHRFRNSFGEELAFRILMLIGKI